MTGRIQEGNHAAWCFHVVSANVLGNAAGFARRDFGATDVVQQRSFTVVHVAHDCHYWGACHRFGLVARCFFFGKGFWIVQSSNHRLVAHFFHHDHRCVLVQRLVDGGHLAEFHQLLDDFRGFDRHLVSQFAHGDGFGHVHFQHACFDRRLWCAIIVTVAVTAAFGASTPAVAAHATTRVTACFDGFLFGLFIGPAGRQLGALDFFVAGRC